MSKERRRQRYSDDCLDVTCHFSFFFVSVVSFRIYLHSSRMKINACWSWLADKVPQNKCVFLMRISLVKFMFHLSIRRREPTFLQTIYLYLTFHRCIRYYKGKHWIYLSESAFETTTGNQLKCGMMRTFDIIN